METGRWTLQLIILFIVLLSWNFDKCLGKTFKIAFLAPASFSNYHINSENSVDGLKLALRSVLKNPNILSGHKIAVKFFDTKCSAQSAVTTAMQAKTSFNPDVIVGPPCQEGLKMVAQLGTYWNLPVLNWYHTGNEFNSATKYPTLVRMIPPVHLLSKAMIHVINQNKLSRISIIYTGMPPWSLLEQPIRDEAGVAGVEIHGVYQVTSNMSMTAFSRMFTHIKRTAQAVVMACSFPDVRNLMLSAASAGMTNGQYVFIHLDPQIYSDTDLATKVLSDGGWKRGDTLDTQARLAYESVLHVIINPITENPGQLSMYPKSKYSDYVKLAVVEGQYSHLEWELPQGLLPDVYSAYLCDGVVVWSGIVDMLFKMGKNYRDGKLIAEYAKRITARGATGIIAMNENLDRLGEVYILDMQPDGNFQPVQNLKFDKNDRYTITNINPSSLPETKTLESILIDRTKKPRPGQPFQGRGFQTTTVALQPTSQTTTTSATTTTTSTTPRPTTQTSTANRNKVQKVMSQAESVSDTFITANPPTQPIDLYTTTPKPRPKVDPHLHNFDVKRKKKRKIYAKAAKMLNQLRQTGDPNVAAFLRIALERLVTEEELIPPHLRHRYKFGRHKRGNAAINLKNKNIAPYRKVPSTSVDPTTAPIVTPSAPETTLNVETTTANIKSSTAASTKVQYQDTPKLTTKIYATTTELPYTEISPRKKRQKKNKNTTGTVQQNRNLRQRKGNRNSKPRRKLRERWSNKSPSTTPFVPTTDATDPPEPEAEPFMTQNMLSSMLSKLTNQLMSKVNGEIQTLKKSFEKVVQLNALAKTEKTTAGTTTEMVIPRETTAKKVIKQALIEMKEAQLAFSKSASTTETVVASSKRQIKPKTTDSTTSPTTYITTKKTHITTTPQPTTTIGTTENIIEETTTEQLTTTMRIRRPEGERKGKARAPKQKRRLRQNWYIDVQQTTPFVPTTDPTEPPEYDVFMAQNMISSLVDKVANKMFGKMNEEIKTLKKSMEKMQSAASTETPITSAVPNTKVNMRQTASYKIPENVKSAKLKTDINESLIKEISANVLRKLNGVSWLTKNSNQPKPESVKSTPEASTGQVDIPKSAKTVITAAPQTEQKTAQTKKPSSIQPATPKMVGSWVSELPFMQMLGIEAIPTKKIKILQTNSSNGTVSSKEKASKLSQTISSINEPSTLNKILLSAKNHSLHSSKRNKLSEKDTTRSRDSKVFKAGPLRKNLISTADDPFALGNSVSLTRKLRMKPITTPSSQKSTTERVPPKESTNMKPKVGKMSVVNLKTTIRNETKSSSVKSNTASKEESSGSISKELSVPKPKVGNMNIVNMKRTNQKKIKSPSIKYEPEVTQVGLETIDIKALVENITESVMGEVQSQMDTLNVSVKDGKIITTSSTTTTTTTTKPILSLRQKFRSSSSRDTNFPRVGIITANSKSDLVKQVSEAVIMTLAHNNTQSNEPAPSSSAVTKQDQHRKEKINTSESEKGSIIVDEITSKVYGKMNAKLNALRRSVSKLQQNMEPPDIDPPEHGRGGGHHMMGGYGPMMPNMPNNMPPFGMFGMPPYTYEVVGPKQVSGPPIPPTTSVMLGPEPTTASPKRSKGETLVVKFDLSQMSKMPWMYPVGPWINGGMPPPPQQNMWGSPGQSRPPWWS